MSSCRGVLVILFQIRGLATNFCRWAEYCEYWSLRRCRRWRWQNEDDSAQGRWWWAGIPQLGTTGFGLAATWIPGRLPCTRFGIAPVTGEVASKPAKCGRVAALLETSSCILDRLKAPEESVTCRKTRHYKYTSRDNRRRTPGPGTWAVTFAAPFVM